jgi:hypothetical protein
MGQALKEETLVSSDSGIYCIYFNVNFLAGGGIS